MLLSKITKTNKKTVYIIIISVILALGMCGILYLNIQEKPQMQINIPNYGESPSSIDLSKTKIQINISQKDYPDFLPIFSKSEIYTQNNVISKVASIYNINLPEKYNIDDVYETDTYKFTIKNYGIEYRRKKNPDCILYEKSDSDLELMARETINEFGLDDSMFRVNLISPTIHNGIVTEKTIRLEQKEIGGYSLIGFSAIILSYDNDGVFFIMLAYADSNYLFDGETISFSDLKKIIRSDIAYKSIKKGWEKADKLQIQTIEIVYHANTLKNDEHYIQPCFRFEGTAYLGDEERKITIVVPALEERYYLKVE